MKPRNVMQEKYVKMITNPDNSIIIATGPAGTGKSCIAVSMGIDLLNKNQYERIVISRPAVAVDEEHGFLPGGIEEKLDPWVRPLYDTFYKYFTPEKVKAMTTNRTIDICPLAYLRGRTLENSFIIVDEAQNCSVNQMLMAMTRIGKGSKMIITGDPSQHDRGREKSGLTDLIQRLSSQQLQDDMEYNATSEKIQGIVHVRFTADHIERHPVIKHVLRLYN
jgi:phosphate starvation-inducible PhoH-like protein